VEARDDLDDAGFEPVVERVGEARQESSPEAHADLWERLGKFCNEIHDPVEGAHEGVTKTRTLSLVPFPSQRHIGNRLRTEADRHN
jgi:hypothetical protein